MNGLSSPAFWGCFPPFAARNDSMTGFIVSGDVNLPVEGLFHNRVICLTHVNSNSFGLKLFGWRFRQTKFNTGRIGKFIAVVILNSSRVRRKYSSETLPRVEAHFKMTHSSRARR
jgi:hypothetical protein